MFDLARKADTDALLTRLEEISKEFIEQMESMREALLDRIRELEEEVAKPHLPIIENGSGDDGMIRGFVPFSARKRNFERDNRKAAKKEK